MHCITVDQIMDQEKISGYKEHYWSNWQNLNMDYRLSNQTTSMLIF